MGCVRACMKPMLPPPPAGAPGAFFSTGSRPTSEGSFGRNMKLATPVMPLSTPGEGERESEREGGSAGEGWGENEGASEEEGGRVKGWMRTGQQQGVLPVEAGVDDGGGGEGGDDVADVLVAGPQAEDETAALLREPVAHDRRVDGAAWLG